mmetsp:Transcript_32684/g.92723  ORF Transcript_32684/g.92723 Transcript_32684/m.92723 type:complete len:219 (+) Transcript_32684:3170-3826(+)
MLSSSVLTLVATTLFAAQAGPALQDWGLWHGTPVLLGTGLLMPLLVYSIRTGRVRWWQWLEVALKTYCYLMMNLSDLHTKITGNRDFCKVPGVVLSFVTSGNWACLRLLGAIVPFAFDVAVSAIPKAPGAQLNGLYVLFMWIYGSHVAIPTFCWCVSFSDIEIGCLGNLLRLSILGGLLMVLTTRVKVETANLLAFLNTPGEYTASCPYEWSVASRCY